ncbi:hypothetical protein FPV67DRAFT_1421983, partial [Lyophyllum atratum]
MESELLSHTYLSQIGLAVNTRINCLICLSCRVALSSVQVISHFGECHVKSGVRLDHTKLREAVTEMMINAKLPEMPSQPILELQGLALHDGMACAICDKVYGKKSTISKHHRLHHPDDPFPKEWKSVKAQQLNKSQYKSYFRVNPRTRPATSPDEEIIAALRQKQIELDGTASVNRLDLRLVSPWLKSTHWLDLVEGKSVPALLALVAPATEEELPGLVPAVHCLFAKAEEHFDLLPELVLQRLNSPDPAKEGINNTPFHRHQDHKERMKQYVLPVIKLVAMLLRSSNLISYDLPPSLCANLDDLRETLVTSSPEDSSVKIHCILITLWTTTWVKTNDRLFPDPTINMLALSMLQQDGSFKHPKHTTGPIAKLEYCMRMDFMVEISQKSSTLGSLGHAHEAQSLEPWYTEKYDSTFNALRSLQHRATTITQTTMGLPRVWWRDRKTYQSMLYEGHHIDFADIQKLFVALECATVQTWEHDILCGLDISVSYKELLDDLTNTTVGYSFISDTRNPFCQDRNLLFTAILKDATLRQRFIAEVDEHGKPIWNQMALKAWLFNYSKFEGLLLVRGEMLGGAPGRMTELTAMTYRNIPTSTHRNFVGFALYLAMLVMYHKGTSMTQSEKLVPHAFDAVTADLIIQDLAIARPFAELAAVICYPASPSVHQVYRDHLFVNNGRLFTTTEISSIMQSYSVPIVKFPIGVHSWRHICLAFKRKLAPALEQLVEEQDFDTVEARQATHSRRTENRIYALSADALAGVAEDVLPLYLDASTDWQIVARVVPGGLGLSYRNALMKHFDNLVSSGIITCSHLGPPSNPPTAQAYTNDLAQIIPDLTKSLSESVVASLGPTIHDIVQNAVREALKTLPSSSSPRMPLSAIEKSPHGLTDVNDELEYVDELATLPNNAAVADDQSSIFCDASRPPDHDDTGRALYALQVVLGRPDAIWSCPEQQDAMLAILAHDTDVCIVLRTGAGKTMLAVIPTLLEGSLVTVVILPLKSLLADYKHKFDKMAIQYEEYLGPPDDDYPVITGVKKLILVTVDKARTPGWKQAIAKVHETTGIKRIVFDESHYGLTGTFRAALLNLQELRSIPVQICLLSGTIPPSSEKALLSAFGMAKSTVMIRSGTDRPELRYIV